MRRSMLLLLAIGWGWLIYGVHHSIGYENAAGYPTMAQDLVWAMSAALPLIFGVLVANASKGWQQSLRFGCIGLLGLEASFIFIFTWLKLFAFLPILGVFLLLWPDIVGEQIIKKRAFSWKRSLQYTIPVMAGLGLFIWWGWFHNPLPSDEDMIKHLNAHRAEFEQLVQGYRNYRRPEGSRSYFYEQSEEVKALMRKIEVYHIKHGGNAWVPNPYSERAAKFRWGLYVHTVNDNDRPLYPTPEDWKREMPELFEGVPPLTNPSHIEQHAGVVIVWPGRVGKGPLDRFTLRYGGITKQYDHYPQVPRVQEGFLLYPDETVDGKPIVKGGGVYLIRWMATPKTGGGANAYQDVLIPSGLLRCVVTLKNKENQK